MRLINTTSLDLEEFLGEPTSPRFPRYAILSHTWGEEEVTFQDMQNREVAKKKAGFGKIAKCCKTALNEGLGWAWVDTCCIDKTSSAELSEAINSMFKWYEYSTVCYAYLSDVGVAELGFRVPLKRRDWRESKWFTRGWTLQELIAPFEVILYDHEWNQLGTKRRLANELEKRTHIPEKVLLDPALRRNSSVAARMSWAVQRETTRIEDRAYSLLGLFDINMPLLYGEGKKAFLRLHGEILNTIEDDTVFLGGLAPSDQDVWLSAYATQIEKNFLVTPGNSFDVLWATIRPSPGTDQLTTQTYSSANIPGGWRRNDPKKDPRLRGDVLSMPMRIIQVAFPNRPPPGIPITMKRRFQLEMNSMDQGILEHPIFDGLRAEGRSLCLGMLRCGTGSLLVARYFMCLLVNDELLACPLPIFRYVSPEEASYWPYMQCHISLYRRVLKPTARLEPLRHPASWGLPETQPTIAFDNGWTLNMDPDLDSVSLVVSDETVFTYRLCFERSDEIWILILTRRGPSAIEIMLQCSTDPEIEAQIVKVNHHEREGPVTELCRKMPVLGGTAELVVSIHYEIDSYEHHYCPMIRFRAFEPSNDEQARTEPKAS
ncbi:heterokaryon incompatibility protein-domain-containing protein [Ustulina deusta]|nr:heterokaryon incompatibility protein-domain-containing protein [Ustulina deusta]